MKPSKKVIEKLKLLGFFPEGDDFTYWWSLNCGWGFILNCMPSFRRLMERLKISAEKEEAERGWTKEMKFAYKILKKEYLDKKPISWSEASKSIEKEGQKYGIDIYNCELNGKEDIIRTSEELRQKCNKLTNKQREKALEVGMKIIKSGEKPHRKTRYCYLVYCNKDPIVYSVYSTKSGALKYAEYLLKYRQEKNAEKGYIVELGHYFINYNKDTKFDKMEKDIFSTYIIVKDKNGQRLNKEYSDDGCWIKVVRKPLQLSFEE